MICLTVIEAGAVLFFIQVVKIIYDDGFLTPIVHLRPIS